MGSGPSTPHGPVGVSVVLVRWGSSGGTSGSHGTLDEDGSWVSVWFAPHPSCWVVPAFAVIDIVKAVATAGVRDADLLVFDVALCRGGTTFADERREVCMSFLGTLGWISS